MANSITLFTPELLHLIIRPIPVHKPADSLFQSGARLKAGVTLEVGDISKGRWHISGLHGQEILGCGLAEGLFDIPDKVQEVIGLMVANIIDSIGSPGCGGVSSYLVIVGIGYGWSIQRQDDTFYDIVDIGKVTGHIPVIVHINGLAFQNSFRETEVGHIRTTPWAIDCEKSKSGGG